MRAIEGIKLLVDGEFARQGGSEDVIFQNALDDTSIRAEDLACDVYEDSEMIELQGRAKNSTYLFLRAKDIGSVEKKVEARADTILWLGWNLLTWHVRNYNGEALTMVELANAPVGVLSRGDIHPDMPACFSIEEFLIFQGRRADLTKYPAWHKKRFSNEKPQKSKSRISEVKPDNYSALDEKHIEAIKRNDVLFLGFGNESSLGEKLLRKLAPSIKISLSTAPSSNNIKNHIEENIRDITTGGIRFAILVHDDDPPCKERERPPVEYLRQTKQRKTSDSKHGCSSEAGVILRATYPTEIELDNENRIKRFVYTSVFVFESYASNKEQQVVSVRSFFPRVAKS